MVRWPKSKQERGLDPQSTAIGRTHYRIVSKQATLHGSERGIGANKRTGKFVGGRAAAGTVIGAIAIAEVRVCRH